MTGDTGLTHIRNALPTYKKWTARGATSDYFTYMTVDPTRASVIDAALAQLAQVEAVIQAARAYVDYPMEGTRRKALRTALAALEDVQ